MTVQNRIRLVDNTRMTLRNTPLRQVPCTIITATAFRRIIRNLRHLIRPTLALVRVVAALVPEAVDLDGVDGAARTAAPPLAHADIGAWLAFDDYAVCGGGVEHGVVVVVEEGVVVAWADCRGEGEEGEEG